MARGRLEALDHLDLLIDSDIIRICYESKSCYTELCLNLLPLTNIIDMLSGRLYGQTTVNLLEHKSIYTNNFGFLDIPILIFLDIEFTAYRVR